MRGWAHRPGDAGKHGERAFMVTETQGGEFFCRAGRFGAGRPGPCASSSQMAKIGEVLIREGT